MAGIPAAVKYAEVGDARPRCACHDRPMIWEQSNRRASGGRWRCGAKRYEITKRLRSKTGTWAYNETHGIGIQAVKRAHYQRTYRRGVNDQKDDVLIAELEAKLKGME